MRRKLIQLSHGFACFLLFSWAAWAQSANPGDPIPGVTLPVELERVLRDYERAWAGKDLAALTRLFTPDGMALPNGRPLARGLAEIEAEYAKAAGNPLALRALGYSVSQDLAYVIGGYSETVGQPDFGKFVLVLRRVAGQWRIVADIENINPKPKPGR